jgi:hypothetical protein
MLTQPLGKIVLGKRARRDRTEDLINLIQIYAELGTSLADRGAGSVGE